MIPPAPQPKPLVNGAKKTSAQWEDWQRRDTDVKTCLAYLNNAVTKPIKLTSSRVLFYNYSIYHCI